MGLILLSLFFAFVLGFSAHRAGVCTVAAISEVMTSRTARIFLSFLKVVLWVLVVRGLVTLLSPESVIPHDPLTLSVSVLVGGFIFGVGAAINKGCGFSTISKIAQGQFSVALTLPAFVAGALIYKALLGTKRTPVNQATLLESTNTFTLPLLLLFAWAIYELIQLLRPVIRDRNFLSRLTSKRYRLSTSAALMGICSGFLYVMHGRWGYSSRLIEYVSAPDAATPATNMTAVYLMLALLAGAAVSALVSRQFKVGFAGDLWYRSVAGGLLMGFGAFMVPGGNAKLILHDLPQLSAHAIGAYLSMVLGTALVIAIQNTIYGKIEVVSCAGDECRKGEEQEFDREQFSAKQE